FDKLSWFCVVVCVLSWPFALLRHTINKGEKYIETKSKELHRRIIGIIGP
ncbi:unnamed protein product, partial [Arabidopsis halleri]